MRIGIYLNSGDIRKNIASQIKRLKECGASRANLWVESPDGRRAPLDLLDRWSDALRENAIEPCLWAFPDAAKAVQAAEYLSKAIDIVQPYFVWLDIERPPPKSPAKEWTPTTISALRNTLDRHGLCRTRMGVTSYPVRSNFMRHVHLDLLPYEYGAPQLYRSAATSSTRERAIREWSEAHRFVVPIVANFLGDAARMDRDIELVTSDRFVSFDVWVLGAMDAMERKVLAKWAKK